MKTINDAATKFLESRTIAVAGVSSKGDTAANIIYKKLREKGYHVFAVNPNTTNVEGDICYPSLLEIPVRIEGVIVSTHPDVTPAILRECGLSGIKQVWIHRSFGQGSYHPDSEKIAEEFSITLIPGSCPMMFCEPVDITHKCMKWFMKTFGNEPVINS